MSTVFFENSVWVQWVRSAAQLPFTAAYALTQAGPRERRKMNEEFADCGLVSPDIRPESACWWNVELYGWTATQQLAAGSPGLAASLEDPRTNGVRNVPLYGTVLYLGETVTFDIGTGAHFSVYAPSVNIGVLAPTGSFAVGNSGQVNFTPTLGAPVNVTSAQVDGHISACVQPITNAPLTFTQTVDVEAASVDVNVPARARTLQIFQNSASLPAAPLNWISDAVTAFDLGEVDFDTPTAPARTSVLEVPSMATILRTNAGGRTLTLVWGLAL